MYVLTQSRTLKFAINTEDTALKSKFNLCKQKTNLGLEIANGIDKFVREVMPIQEEEKASEKPAAKARPILKPSPTSGWDSTLMNRDNGLTLKYRNRRMLIVFKRQNSLLDCFDTVNKFVEKKMVESIATKLLVNARRNYRRYRILVRRNEEALRPCSGLVT